MQIFCLDENRCEQFFNGQLMHGSILITYQLIDQKIAKYHVLKLEYILFQLLLCKVKITFQDDRKHADGLKVVKEKWLLWYDKSLSIQNLAESFGKDDSDDDEAVM